MSSHPPETVERNRRRSTISTISHDLRRSIVSATTSLDQRLHSHTVSTIALCSCVLTMFYLLMNCFPYSGFMAMQLVPGLTEESAGTHAGILSSSFMVGRAFSSYPWGKIADVYGRKFVLVVSLVNSALFSLSFGFSTSFAWAVASRFLMGIGNGIMLIARTSVSELARGDHELESRGMGLIMSMVGYGMLLAPAIGGALSEPMTQYPNAHWFGGRFDVLLTKFPFILPNIVASILSLLSLVFVVVSIEETLPKEKQRPIKYLVPDVCNKLLHLPMSMWNGITSLVEKLASWSRPADYEQVSTTTTTTNDDDDDADSIEDDLKILEQREASELSALLSSPASRASYTSAMHRPSVAISSKAGESSVKSATVKSLLGNKSTRECLAAYWMNSFVNVAVNEAFPLFCMSNAGGLGLAETQIGGIGTAAGAIFCVFQYVIFSYGMSKFGLIKSLVYASFLSNIPVILFPISLLTSGWVTFAFLSILMAVLMIFNSVFYANMTIVTNRTVEASHRATLNGLSSVGASVGRAGGPIFAGSLVAFCLSSGILPAETYGAVVIYTVLAALGVIAFASTAHLAKHEEEQEKRSKGIEIENINAVEEDGQV